MSEKLQTIYDRLLARFGPQHWWPGESRFEIIVGAILTQNTNWLNVEKALANLKDAGVLDPQRMHRLDTAVLAGLIRPAGYYNIKAARIGNFLTWLFKNHQGSLGSADTIATDQFRQELLAIKGIGPETADSILLYAFNRPVFVIDAYTARVMVRHRFLDASSCDYCSLQEIFTSGLPHDAQLYNEFHALIVTLGKDYCRKIARCENCPLEDLPHDAVIEQY